jgi:SAM-dependent methyltransferase
MAEYDTSTYGQQIADIYDDLYSAIENVDTMAGFLAARAKGGRALELGIGTGRVALPLAKRGVEVHGIDGSPAMVAKMRAKSGGLAIPVTIGNFAGLPVEGEFGIIYVVFNTFFSLLTQEEQVACFQQVANHLTLDGVFVIEAFVPDLSRFDRGQRLAATRVQLDEVQIEATVHDLQNQQVNSHHVLISQRGVRLYPVQLRYAWPSERDLMARIAGLRLRERFAGWQREPVTATSAKHVSVFEREPKRSPSP